MPSDRVKEATLWYPGHQLKPEDFMHFVNLDEFTEDWRDLKLDEDDLWALELCIMSAPSEPPVIAGTGGLRKLKFAPKQWGQGKRGAARILYVYFEEFWIVMLVKAYRKNKKEDISDEEKKGISNYIKATETWLKTSGGRRGQREA